MGRKKKGTPVHGWVIVDKPEGITSTQVVGIVKRVFDAQKAGHAGTLDPMATGVLAVALGEATKTVPYAMDAREDLPLHRPLGPGHRFRRCRGQGDRHLRACVPTPRGDRGGASRRSTGEISQIPPIYSAIKVQGERAYDLAREGEAVELQPRIVEIHEARLVEMPDADHAVFEMHCGKGAYVRAWVRDLARALGTVGHVCQLRRTRIGGFSAEDAIALETLKGFMHSPAAFEHLRPISTALDGIPALAVTGPDAVRLRSGNPILCRAAQFARLTEEAGEDDDLQGLTVYLSTAQGEPIALAELAEGELRPFRVFNFG